MKWMKMTEKNFNKTNLIKALREAKHFTNRTEDRKEIARFIRLIDLGYGKKTWQDPLDKDAYVLQRILSFTYSTTIIDGQDMSAMFEVSGWILDNFNWEIDTYTLDYFKEMRKWDLC